MTNEVVVDLAIRQIINHLRGRHKKSAAAPERKQEWSIGIYKGDSPVSIKPVADVRNPVLSRAHVSDARARYIADPFMVHSSGRWFMFFEVLNGETGRGEIGLATSANGLDWKYEKIILAEPFHMSYPYVFEWQKEYYMIPEAWRSGGVKLYKARNFPDDWSCIGNMLCGERFADSSIVRHNGKWWLFTDAGASYKSPSLRLYHSEDLMGTWVEHPLSPVQSSPHTARPGGRIVCAGGQLMRFAQDVFPVYGSQVHVFEIQELSPAAYKEKQVTAGPLLSAGSDIWNSGGMHHVDPHRLADGTWLACVDGFLWREQK
ncbi:MAG: hypothetical protein HZB61_03010 [Nitrospirae bacterium]|nr:hypothetical protein [Nitrospirota bacterium]